MSLFKALKSALTPAPRASAAEGMERVRSGRAVLIDVREPDEWRSGVAQGAELLPLSDLNGPRQRWASLLAGPKDRELLLYCASGGRSGMAARILTTEGFTAFNTGGLADWHNAGWPVANAK
jgi:rhodanese-related sulfurtransferase